MGAGEVEKALMGRWREYPLVGLVPIPASDFQSWPEAVRSEFQTRAEPWAFWPHAFLRWMVHELGMDGEPALAGDGAAGVYRRLDDRLRAGAAQPSRCSLESSQKDLHEFYRARRSRYFVCDTEAWEGPYYFVNLLAFQAVSPSQLSSQIQRILPRLRKHPDFHEAMSDRDDFAAAADRSADLLGRIWRDVGAGLAWDAPIMAKLMRVPAALPLLVRAIRHILAAEGSHGGTADDLFGFDPPSIPWKVEDAEWDHAGPRLRLPPLRTGCTWVLHGNQVVGPTIPLREPTASLDVQVHEGGGCCARYRLHVAPRAWALDSESPADLDNLFPGQHLFLFQRQLLRRGNAIVGDHVACAEWARAGFRQAVVEVTPGDRIEIDGRVLSVPHNLLPPPRFSPESVVTEFDPLLLTKWPPPVVEATGNAQGIDIRFSPETGAPAPGTLVKARWEKRGVPISDWSPPHVLAQEAVVSPQSFRVEGRPWTRWLRLPPSLTARVGAGGSFEDKGSGWWLVRSTTPELRMELLGAEKVVAKGSLGAPLARWRLVEGSESPPEWQEAPLLLDPSAPATDGRIDVFFDHAKVSCRFRVEGFQFRMVSNREGFIQLSGARLAEYGLFSGGRALYIENRDGAILVAGPPAPLPPPPPPPASGPPGQLGDDGFELGWLPSVPPGGTRYPCENLEVVQVPEQGPAGELRLVAQIAGDRIESEYVPIDGLGGELHLALDLPDPARDRREVSLWFEHRDRRGLVRPLDPCGQRHRATLASIDEWTEHLRTGGQGAAAPASRERLFRVLVQEGLGEVREQLLRDWHEQGRLPRTNLLSLLRHGGFKERAWRLGCRRGNSPQDDLDAFWAVIAALENPELAREQGPTTGDWIAFAPVAEARKVVRAIAGVRLASLGPVGSADSGGSLLDLGATEGLTLLIRGLVSLLKDERILPLDWRSAAEDWSKVRTDALPGDWRSGVEFLRVGAAVMAGVQSDSALLPVRSTAAVAFVRRILGMKALSEFAATTAEALEVYEVLGGDAAPTDVKRSRFWPLVARWLARNADGDQTKAQGLLREVKAQSRGNLLLEAHLETLLTAEKSHQSLKETDS